MAEVSARRITSLPAECLTHILRYLPTASLRQTASVSRRFYACAWDAGLVIPRRLSSSDPKRIQRQLADFNALVEHALPKNLPLSLTFYWFPPLQHKADGDYPRMRHILRAITGALPLLVKLWVSAINIEQVVAILCRPMSRLRDLTLMRAYHFDRDPFPVPHDLLAGDAPLLRKLKLSDAALPAPPLLAFSHVTSLHFSYYFAPLQLAFAHYFPNLQDLTLNAHCVRDPALDDFDLSGLALQSLTAHAMLMPAIQRAVSLDTIRLFSCEYHGFDIDWAEHSSKAVDGVDFSLRLFLQSGENSQLTIVLVPAHRCWRRIYAIRDWYSDTLPPLADKPGGRARLTYLRLENSFLNCFLSCDAEFPALQRVQIDFSVNSVEHALVWPPDSVRGAFAASAGFRPAHRSAPTFDGTQSPYDVPCPALRELALFAVNYSESIVVQAREVAFLGRALGQLHRAQREKAALALVGVEFAVPEARELLGLTFCAVRLVAFAERRLREDRDDGLWGDITVYEE